MHSTEVVRSDSLDDADQEPVFTGTAATVNPSGMLISGLLLTLSKSSAGFKLCT